ncbi:MAG: PGPGW domain-containing protein [Candidatus Neomarinimicrobiota bacterium]
MMKFLFQDTWLPWIQTHRMLLGLLGGLSILTFLGTLLVIPFILARMPADYFVRQVHRRKRTSGLSRTVHYLFLILKNFIGVLFLMTGFAMLFIPGQGVLTILIGISLMSFPGKRRLERKIVQKPSVLSAINWIRSKAGKEPLILEYSDR